MTMHSNHTDPATHPRIGTGTQGHDPDYDSPWWCDHPALPNEARCETCGSWCYELGWCVAFDGRVTRAEDRCTSWRPHPQHAVEVAERRNLWTEADAVSARAEWDRQKRRRLRYQLRVKGA